ncbi:hypothetical protein TNCT_621151 [Trichonephila clavata]|uniref:Uncharacterized protein n=1 Tax=Trichonephila clavata TaxID=2740835 RepID=A0A8X6L0M6_TRICU|nr:hypothetical protein TNCT_621151 [Trichonephila clavata]
MYSRSHPLLRNSPSSQLYLNRGLILNEPFITASFGDSLGGSPAIGGLASRILWRPAPAQEGVTRHRFSSVKSPFKWRTGSRYPF